MGASAFPKLPVYFTEWSTSYTPRDVVHDSYVSAPYILSKLKASEGFVQGMSYWTYTDLFEEPGPPTAAFEGGFGLLSRDGIRKPAFFAYKYLHALQGRVLKTSDPQSMIAVNGSKYRRGPLGLQAATTKSQQPFFLHKACALSPDRSH